MKLLSTFFAFQSFSTADPAGPRGRTTCQDFKVEKNVDYPGIYKIILVKNKNLYKQEIRYLKPSVQENKLRE